MYCVLEQYNVYRLCSTSTRETPTPSPCYAHVSSESFGKSAAFKDTYSCPNSTSSLSPVSFPPWNGTPINTVVSSPTTLNATSSSFVPRMRDFWVQLGSGNAVLGVEKPYLAPYAVLSRAMHKRFFKINLHVPWTLQLPVGVRLNTFLLSRRSTTSTLQRKTERVLNSDGSKTFEA